MRFLVDESTGPVAARWLAAGGHEVCSINEVSPGISDEEIIMKAVHENWVIVTNDKDFGEKIYREHYVHRGVIFMRLIVERNHAKIEALQRVLDEYPDRIADNFLIVTESRIRFGK